ncbi:MAG TPA: hypothetical protein PLD20_00945 [Blastocatellia bacterium]|nr:hypothetical protein [Blastocatellia bacterium]HMV81814.1 hypothetical protein [Blastocatellia bacterium]HMX24005.1 hypothetical protein [Blastocatellia bacterium]HMY70435.1 hypothetical protein [Blastocatellia bacterium]HMZ16502.1 hypothetical protein [Blastocatellia bacterium]
MKHQITKSFWADDETRKGEIRFSGPIQVLSTPLSGKGLPVGEVSQFKNSYGSPSATEEISPLSVNEILPRAEDLYYVTMRALSQRLVEGYWIDYTRPGVLQAAVPLLNKQRICVDHCYWKAESAIGAIVNSVWDAEGANANGLPGINIRFFVDSKIAPGIVRRLAYPVPAIHSGSVTVGFEWEASHPDLLEEKKFWWFLGEEVGGEIVRLIVTKIVFFREFSLVYEGADEDAKRLPDEDAPMPEGETEQQKRQLPASQSKPPEGGTINKETTVKLTAEQKKILGLESQAADDVPDAVVLAAIERFAPQVTASQAIIAAERAEVLRLATLAEVGAEGKLPEALAGIIQQADAGQLPSLKQMYAAKAETRFGVGKDGIGRSSKEEPPTTPVTAQQAVEPPRMSFL